MSMRVRPLPVPPRNLTVNAPETDFQPLVTNGGSEQIKRSVVYPPSYFGLPNTYMYICVFILYIYICINTGMCLDYTFVAVGGA